MAMLAVHPRRLKTVKLPLYKEFCAVEGLMRIRYWHGYHALYLIAHTVHNYPAYVNWELYARILARSFID